MTTDPLLRAGAAEVDITPEMGIQIAGDIGRLRPVQEIRERIYAKALVLEAGGTRCCILSVEVCYLTHQWVDEVRRRAAEQFGLDPHAIMIHAIQNHSAPAIGNAAVSDAYTGIPPELWWLRSGDARYNEPAVRGIVAAIGQAQARLQPVTVLVGREIDGRAAFNRRFVLRDGAAIAHPWGEDARQILYCEGPIDPEVGVMVLRGQDGANVAALLHYTCHPVHGYPMNYISGDWPGAWASAMRGALGAGCVALVINGCCGNIHHHNHLDPAHVNNYLRMGSLLAESATRAMQSLVEQPSATLAWTSEQVRIPLRELPHEEVEAARALLAAQPEAPMLPDPVPSVEWDWVYAHAMMDLAATHAQQPYYDYEVQSIRIADSAVVALTGEPFVEGQLDLKMRSAFPHTFVAHMANGYVGYVPTREALRRGGRSFEIRTSNWAKLIPEALEMVVDTAVTQLAALAERM
jgi:neutral ceramidase